MVTFEKSGAQEYRLLYYAGGDLSIYEAHLLQLGSSLFLDVAPEDAAFEQLVENQSYTHQLVTVHTFHRIRLEGDKLDSAYFNAFWLRDKIEAKEISLTLSNPGSGGYLLTASTEELQELVAQYADEPGAFEPLDEFHRLPDEAGKVKQNPGDKEEP
jgi:hypothetical protein